MPNPTVLITGWSGLASTLGRYLSGSGYQVLFLSKSINEKRMTRLQKRELKDLGYFHHDSKHDWREEIVAPWDVTNPMEVQKKLMGELMKTVGSPIVGLVINAAKNIIKKDSKFTEDDLNAVIDVNVKGYLRTILLAQKLKYLQRVVVITSVASRIPMKNSLIYNASKAACDMMVLQTARQVAERGVSVFGVRPGKIADTGMTKYVDKAIPRIKGWSRRKADEYQMSQIPMGRYVDKREIASLVRYLVTVAPPSMTGCIIDIACGQ